MGIIIVVDDAEEEGVNDLDDDDDDDDEVELVMDPDFEKPTSAKEELETTETDKGAPTRRNDENEDNRVVLATGSGSAENPPLEDIPDFDPPPPPPPSADEGAGRRAGEEGTVCGPPGDEADGDDAIDATDPRRI